MKQTRKQRRITILLYIAFLLVIATALQAQNPICKERGHAWSFRYVPVVENPVIVDTDSTSIRYTPLDARSLYCIRCGWYDCRYDTTVVWRKPKVEMHDSLSVLYPENVLNRKDALLLNNRGNK